MLVFTMLPTDSIMFPTENSSMQLKAISNRGFDEGRTMLFEITTPKGSYDIDLKEGEDTELTLGFNKVYFGVKKIRSNTGKIYFSPNSEISVIRYSKGFRNECI